MTFIGIHFSIDFYIVIILEIHTKPIIYVQMAGVFWRDDPAPGTVI